MPLAIFLISVIVSSSLYVSTARISQDSQVNQALVASTSAFYTASSSAEVTWTEVTPENSEEIVEVFQAQDTGTGIDQSQDYLPQVFSSFDENHDSLEFNKGIEAKSARTGLSMSDVSSFVDQHFQSSAEVFLYQVPPSKAIDSIQVDYCSKDAGGTCPDLIVEWFRLKSSFQFQKLDELVMKVPDLNPLESCMDLTEMGIERCVVRVSSSDSGSKLALKYSSAGSDSLYKRSLNLTTQFTGGDHYLFRFRSEDKIPFHFEIYGKNGSMSQQKAPLPTAYKEVDEIGMARFSFRRIREQQQVSGGLQDGLEFVHFAEMVENK